MIYGYKKICKHNHTRVSVPCRDGVGFQCLLDDTCTSTFVEMGMQLGCVVDESTQCSANFITSNAVDVFFQTGGLSGEVICYAFTVTDANRFETPRDMSRVQSKASVVVSEEYKNYDHQVTLKNLQPSVEYNVYCSMGVERNALQWSNRLDIKTIADAKISSVSMAVGNDKNSKNIGSIRLSFRVGAGLLNSDIINVTFYDHDTFRNAEIISANSGCTITSTDRSSTIAADFSVPTTKTLVAALTQGCKAGSRVTIECDSRNLGSNDNNSDRSHVNFLMEIGQSSSSVTQKLYHQLGYIIQ